MDSSFEELAEALPNRGNILSVIASGIPKTTGLLLEDCLIFHAQLSNHLRDLRQLEILLSRPQSIRIQGEFAYLRTTSFM